MSSPSSGLRMFWILCLLAGLASWSVFNVRHQLVDQSARSRPATNGNGTSSPDRIGSISLVGNDQEKDESESDDVSTAQFTEEEVARSVLDELEDPLPDDAVEARRPFDLEWQESAWRNPFHKKLWIAPGWISITRGMQGSGTARYRKTYAHLSLSLIVEAVEEFEIPEPTLRLENVDDPTRALVIHWNRRNVQLWRERQGAARALYREADIPELKARREHPQRRQIQVIATGNRLIVAESGRRLVFCDQPSEISGQPFRFTLNVGDQEVRLHDLRIDGE